MQRRLALPPHLVALSLVEHLHPAVFSVRPAWFLVTYFTAPSSHEVFTRQPLYLWRAPYALVTISPWARRQSVLEATGDLDETRDGFLCRVLEAAFQSHEEVGQRLNEAFFADDRGLTTSAWHRKERRVMQFTQLLRRQLDLLRVVGLAHDRVQRVYQRLMGLLQIVRYAEDKLRQSGYCEVCRRQDSIEGHRGN